MAREVDGYRDQLETNNERAERLGIGDKELYNCADVQAMTGMSRGWVKKYILNSIDFVSKTQLARIMAKGI